MSKTPEISLKKDQEFVIKNITDSTEKIHINYNEYGSVEIELIIGASITITGGIKPPVISCKNGINSGVTLAEN